MSSKIRTARQFEKKKAKKHLVSFIQRSDPAQDYETDDDGRLVIFTDLFLWSDFTIRDLPEKESSVIETEDNDEDDKDFVEEEFPLVQP